MSGSVPARSLGDAALLVELGELPAAHRLLHHAATATATGHGFNI